MNTYRTTLRKIQNAVRSTLRSLPATRAAFDRLEDRRLMSATSVKSVDSGGPDFEMVESNGHVIVLSSSASGAGQNQIWRTDGDKKTSKLLVDGKTAAIQSYDDIAVASDGTVYFTATGGTNGGRQLFKLNVENGGYTQVTSDKNAFYKQVTLVGNKVYMVNGNDDKILTFTSKGKLAQVGSGDVTGMFVARDSLFWVLGSDGGLWRADDTTTGTKISGSLSFGASKVFATNNAIFFEGNDGNDRNLYRTDGATPTIVTEDFSLVSSVVAEAGDTVYVSGYGYSGSEFGQGSNVFKIITSTGEMTKVTNLEQTNGGASPAGLGLIGTSLYFVANDGDYINAAGTYDRELWRYDTTAGTTTKVTDDETLYPIETGAGVLSSYYFVAAPTKADSRFGSRRLYRTSPNGDAVEEVAGLPSYTDSNGNTKEDVSLVFGGSKGLFYSARNNDGTGGDYDTYFVPTPYTYVESGTNELVVTATDSNDALTVTVDDGDLVFNLNGVEERREIGTFAGIRIYLKGGDDQFTADASVTQGLYVTGDSGNDTLIGGSGNDNLLAGGGKNRLYGMKGQDRVRGGGGADYLDGGDDNDRLYGYAGSDVLQGGNGVDYLYGDDVSGAQAGDSLYGGSGNDRLYGRGDNDLLVGGKQNDSLFGGEGDDSLQGQDGNDYLEGAAGADDLIGGNGDDTFADEADGAVDLIDGGQDDDTLLGRDDDDKVKLVEVVA